MIGVIHGQGWTEGRHSGVCLGSKQILALLQTNLEMMRNHYCPCFKTTWPSFPILSLLLVDLQKAAVRNMSWGLQNPACGQHGPLPWFSLASLLAAQIPPSPGSWAPSSACTTLSGRITRSTSSSLSFWLSSSSSSSSSSTPCREPSAERLSWAPRGWWRTQTHPFYWASLPHL